MFIHRWMVYCMRNINSCFVLLILAKMHRIWTKQYCLPDSNVHGANMGPTWVLSASDGPHVGPMNLAIRELRHDGKYDPVFMEGLFTDDYHKIAMLHFVRNRGGMINDLIALVILDVCGVGLAVPVHDYYGGNVTEVAGKQLLQTNQKKHIDLHIKCFETHRFVE